MPGDDRWAAPRHKDSAISGPFRGLLSAMTVAVLLGACSNATGCIDRVPEARRADLVRLVVERGMLRTDEVPASDLDRARLYGRDPASLTEDELRDLSPLALGYAHCVRSITRRN